MLDVTFFEGKKYCAFNLQTQKGIVVCSTSAGDENFAFKVMDFKNVQSAAFEIEVVEGT